MRKHIYLITCIIMVALCMVHIVNAANYPIGKMKLSAVVIDIANDSISASGKAVLTMPNATISAKNIEVELTGKNRAFSKGTATGGVVIHAKQVDAKTGATQIIDATSDSAVMVQGENSIVLQGNVSAKITDPQQLTEPATINGPKSLTIFLNQNKIRVEGSEDSPANLTATPKEKSK